MKVAYHRPVGIQSPDFLGASCEGLSLRRLRNRKPRARLCEAPLNPLRVEPGHRPAPLAEIRSNWPILCSVSSEACAHSYKQQPRCLRASSFSDCLIYRILLKHPGLLEWTIGLLLRFPSLRTRFSLLFGCFPADQLFIGEGWGVWSSGADAGRAFHRGRWSLGTKCRSAGEQRPPQGLRDHRPPFLPEQPQGHKRAPAPGAVCAPSGAGGGWGCSASAASLLLVRERVTSEGCDGCH